MVRVGMIGLGSTGAEMVKVLLQQKELQVIGSTQHNGIATLSKFDDFPIISAMTVEAVHYIFKKKGYYKLSSQTPPRTERKGKEHDVPSPSGNSAWSHC